MRSALLGLLVLSACPAPRPAGPAASPAVDAGPVFSDPACVSRSACPSVATPPPCSETGTEGGMRGRVRRGDLRCSTAACLPGTCCNTCQSPILLENGTLLAGSVALCEGDDSGVCCPLEVGVEIVVFGAISQVGGVATLDVTGLCSP